MENKDLNRIKMVLVEKHRTSKWLSEQLGKDPTTVSKWCRNNLISGATQDKKGSTWHIPVNATPPKKIKKLNVKK